MDSAGLTNKQLAIVLLNRLIDLDVERIAMANILDFVRDPVSAQPLDWRPTVWASHDQILRDIVSGKYAETLRAMQDSTSDCPDALSLLESASKGLVRESSL